MGGGNSVSNTVTAVNTAISKNIISAVQKNAQGVNLTQLMKLNCDDMAKNYNLCLKGLENQPNSNLSPDDLIKEARALCQVGALSCSVNNVVMNQTVDAKDISQSSDEIAQSVKDTSSQDIGAAVKQASGLLEFGNDINQKIDSTVKSVQTAVTDLFTSNFSEEDFVQQLVLDGATVSFVTMNQLSDTVFKSIISNKSVSSSVQDLGTSVQASVDQTSGFSSSTLTTIIIAILAGLVGIAVLIFLFKKLRSTKPPAAQVIESPPAPIRKAAA